MAEEVPGVFGSILEMLVILPGVGAASLASSAACPLWIENLRLQVSGRFSRPDLLKKTAALDGAAVGLSLS
jgi:hypothetical protein